jgi:hypothetical protein
VLYCKEGKTENKKGVSVKASMKEKEKARTKELQLHTSILV